jgi:transcriptional regulator with XRE-family HTH domain
MPAKRHNTASRTTVPRSGDFVKAQIIAAGLTLADVSTKAGFARTTLSDYISGRIRTHDGQWRIWHAFCELSGRSPSLREFWGILCSSGEAA